MNEKYTRTFAWLILALYHIEEHEGRSDLWKELNTLLEKYTLLRRDNK